MTQNGIIKKEDEDNLMTNHVEDLIISMITYNNKKNNNRQNNMANNFEKNKWDAYNMGVNSTSDWTIHKEEQ